MLFDSFSIISIASHNTVVTQLLRHWAPFLCPCSRPGFYVLAKVELAQCLFPTCLH